MKKLTKFILSILTGVMALGMTTFAAEYSVTPATAVFFTNENTIVLDDAAADAQVILPSCASDLPILVTGITSNGYWQINLADETYYIAGIGLSPAASNGLTVPAPAQQTTPVTLPSCASDLPVLVTGITSNGYWQINLADETYYIAGIGLSPAASNGLTVPAPAQQTTSSTGATTTTATTTTTTTTTPTAPATTTGSKYVCVIEEGDEELLPGNWNQDVRKDYTNNAIYIYIRDQLELAYKQGKSDFEVEYSIQDYTMYEILKNLCVDFLKAHPDTRMWMGAVCPTSSYDNPFDGTDYATYYIGYYTQDALVY